MIEILYCIYVGIRSFHPVLPFIKANDLIAIAPLPADLIRPLDIRTFVNWLDDDYLNSRARARNNPSRFTESEDYSPLLDPIYCPRHSGYAPTSGSLKNGTVQRSAPSNILTKISYSHSDGRLTSEPRRHNHSPPATDSCHGDKIPLRLSSPSRPLLHHNSLRISNSFAPQKKSY